MSVEKYPKYYKSVKGVDEIDVYAVHALFGIDDCSGALQHASKKLLLSGVRTGGKTKHQDIEEARDTLNRWLAINNEDTTDGRDAIRLNNAINLPPSVVRDAYSSGTRD